MTLQITRPEVEALIRERLQSGQFADAEEVILEALRSTTTEPAGRKAQRREAIERLKSFGKRHRLSLGGLTIRELREKARP
jgi:Arc/MetJ-type ribon-helix-helix transcriptional regulator